MGSGELKHICNAFDINWISTIGPHINELEKQLADYTSANHAVVLSSGTAAIHLALQMLGVSSGDSVLCQSFTFAGSAFPVTYQGAKPIFIDSETDTWNMDPDVLEDSILKLKAQSSKLKAIIPVHLYGMPYRINEIHDIALQYGIPVIEDAAEALGSKYHDQPCGSFGDFGVLSFNGNKIITTSGGGALLSDNKEYIGRAKFLATQARDDSPHYEHSQIGYNYRMGNINAAIGLGQMEVLDERVQRKREIFKIYKSELASFEDIKFPEEPEGHFSNRWLTTIVTKSFEQREYIRFALEKENIEARPLWKPMHLQPVFKDADYFGGNVADGLFNRGLCLPSGTAITEQDLGRIIEIIRKVFNRRGRKG